MAEKKPPWASIVFLVAFGIGGLVWWWYGHTHVDTTAAHAGRNEGAAAVTGNVKYIDASNKALNAKAMGASDLDAFLVVDSTGEIWIWFDPAAMKIPAEGSRVRARGRMIRERGSGVLRFVAIEVTAI